MVRHPARTAWSSLLFGLLTTSPANAQGDPGTGHEFAPTLDSVAGLGDVNGDGYADVALGAPLHSNGEYREGAIFVFLGGPEAATELLKHDASQVLESDSRRAYFGASVASAGDVNGDGYGDVVVGAPRYSNGQDAEGAFFVFHGGPDGLVARHLSEAEDGYGDVLAGAPGFAADQVHEGAAVLFLGSPQGIRYSSRLDAGPPRMCLVPTPGESGPPSP